MTPKSADYGLTCGATPNSGLVEAPQPTPATSLTHIEALAAQALFSGDTARARREVETLARHLAEERDGGSSRRQIVSTELAMAHIEAVALRAMLGSLVKKKDESGARLVSRLLTDATKRMVLLASAHAGPRPRPVLVVGHAENVSISAEGTR